MKKIAIIPNHTKDTNLSVTGKLIEELKSRAEVYMNNKYKDSGFLVNYGGDEIYSFVDAVIVLGGDGTILQAAEPCGKRGIPVMGINLGKVGFMTEIEPDDIKTAVEKLLKEDYKIEERMMMKVSVCDKDKVLGEYYALNDAVISKPDSQMISMELYRETEKINEYIADGVVIATPTGSTGYSLSAGGPVADPTMELFIATPICGHRLSSRTALLPSNKKVSVKLIDGGNSQALLTVDGQVKKSITKDEYIEIKKAEEKIKLIKMGSQSFYDVLTNKLS